MDSLRLLLEEIRRRGLATGNLLGLLHVAIGRKISLPDGAVIASGVSWRDLAALLKRLRWDPEQVREIGLDPALLPPRDRQKYWLTAIIRANVGSPDAVEAGDRLAEALRSAGYVVGTAPGA